MELVEFIAKVFTRMRPILDERETRLLATAMAEALGHGGGKLVTEATGIRSKRIWKGKGELRDLAEAPPERPASPRRVRRPGGGRKRLSEKDPGLWGDMEALVEPLTRGDPESPLRWTAKSTATLARELRSRGHQIGPRTVSKLLHEHGYSMQVTQKTIEGRQHPDRNAQFEHINEQTKALQAAGQPVISVDTKKKELVGEFANKGREWHPGGEPEKVRVHDFIDREKGKAIPYGVYDVNRNEGWVGVGIDHDTAAFAVSTIRTWWRAMGSVAYPEAKDLYIVADSGGSNSSRSRLWKAELQKFADDSGLQIHVSHLPPGTSKWNKIEHRLFSQISLNWRGRPLTSHEAIVKLIGSTRTSAGLRVRARLDKRRYPLKVRVPQSIMRSLRLERSDFHGEWNYTFNPGG